MHKYKLLSRVDLTSKVSLVSIPSIDLLSKDAAEIETLQKIANDNNIDTKKGLQYGEIEVIISNSGLDRYGESIKVEGIDLTQVKRNPVVLWAHDYSGLPIGQLTKVWKSNGNLMGRIKLDYDIYEFADTVYKMVLRGTINAVSIGGLVKEFGKTDDGGTDYSVIKSLEMVEVSIVPVGAHPDALVVSKSLGISEDEFKGQYEEFVKQSLIDKTKNLPYDEVSKHIKALKFLISALEDSYMDTSKDTESNPKVKRIRKLVLARSNAKQIDRQAELIISSIKNKLGEEK